MKFKEHVFFLFRGTFWNWKQIIWNWKIFLKLKKTNIWNWRKYILYFDYTIQRHAIFLCIFFMIHQCTTYFYYMMHIFHYIYYSLFFIYDTSDFLLFKKTFSNLCPSTSVYFLTNLRIQFNSINNKWLVWMDRFYVLGKIIITNIRSNKVWKK